MSRSSCLARHRRQGAAVLLLFATALAAPVAAHDFWIEPEKFRAGVSDTLPLRLYVGEEFKGDALLYNPADFERYIYTGPTGVRPVQGELGDDPAGRLPISGAGTYVVGFEGKRREARYDSSAEFGQYLKSEGIGEKVIQALERANRGILEIYTRCAKALVRAGAGATLKTVDQVLGFPLELVALTSPYSNDRAVTVQLLFRGKPLDGAQLIAFPKQQPQAKVRAQTDKDGHATLDLSGPGIWLVSAVHVLPLPSLARADYESYWASLTFERAEAH
jgi:uncharacterized GH25 family protein